MATNPTRRPAAAGTAPADAAAPPALSRSEQTMLRDYRLLPDSVRASIAALIRAFLKGIAKG